MSTALGYVHGVEVDRVATRNGPEAVVSMPYALYTGSLQLTAPELRRVAIFLLRAAEALEDVTRYAGPVCDLSDGAA